MERELGELQFLDIVGVVAEAFKILRSAAKLLCAITLTLLLPLSFAILGHSLISEPLFKKILRNKLLLPYEEGTSMEKETLHKLYVEIGELFLFEAAYISFVFAFSLLSTAAVVYTVASVYTRKELTYARVMSVVPRVWKRLIVTFLWYFAVMLAYYVAVLFAVFWLILIIGKENLKSGRFFFGLLVITIISFSVHVYIGMVWHVACVVSVLEERWGLGAMKKSKDLIKGWRGTALALNILYLLIMGGIGWFFQYGVVHGRYHQIGAGEMTANAALLVALQCGFNLLWWLVQSVFYFVCKSFHHESIDKSALSDHLEAYRGLYMPLKDNNIQLEHFDP
ncbi:hypothetical protein SUGI_1196700 [Cryptomeria japonica]|uniref:uncharacterized protein LOC131078992 n=1 Tax=Cryptomeria japonica TaxID=3369 RepID=UPI002414B2AF|nr:uncharacterized protein LOC131078992 [Cryptomeria japonica]GLJ55710.1 hypothetical protein SUGI_1196700 [Cryptomeria japonica]